MNINISTRTLQMHEYIEGVEAAGNRFLILIGDEEERRRIDRMLARLNSALHVSVPIIETGHEVADAFARAIGVRPLGEVATVRRCIAHCRAKHVRRIVVSDAHHVYYDPRSRMYPERSFVLAGSAVQLVILIGDVELKTFLKNQIQRGRRAHVAEISDVLRSFAGVRR